MAGIIHALLLLLIILVAAPLALYPLAALAAILISVALKWATGTSARHCIFPSATP